MLPELTTGERAARIGLIFLNGFLGVSAVLGGAALLFGWLGIPNDLLAGSPFGSYTIPALLLIVLVGGSGLLATALVLRRLAWDLAASSLAGAIIVAFEAVELVVIGFSWLLALYVAIGLAILLLAAGLRLRRHEDSRSPQPLVPDDRPI
jgi:hypothetical protein